MEREIERSVLMGIRHRLSRHGVYVPDDEFVVDVPISDNAIAHVSRMRHPSEGHGGVLVTTRIIGPEWHVTGGKRGMRMVAGIEHHGMVDSLARAHRRDRALGVDPHHARRHDYPTWTYEASAAALAFMDAYGVDREHLTSVNMSGYADRSSVTHSVEDETFEREKGMLEIYFASSVAGRMSFEMDHDVDEGTSISLNQKEDRMTIVLRNVQMPSTLDHRHAGRRLGDLVSHPILDLLGDAVVMATSNDPKGFAIDIPLDFRPLSPAPEGRDAEWMAIDPGAIQ